MTACAWCGHDEMSHHPTATETWCIVGIASENNHCPCPGYNPNSELRLKSIKEDLSFAVADTWALHNDRCLSSDNCRCIEIATRIEKAFGLEEAPEFTCEICGSHDHGSLGHRVEYHHHFVLTEESQSIAETSCSFCGKYLPEKCTGPKEAGK